MRVTVFIKAVSKVGSVPFEQSREVQDSYDAVHAALRSCYQDIWNESRAKGFHATELVYSTYITPIN